jgi:lysophospholipase L1-like esterase
VLAGEELRFVALGDSTTVGVGDRVTDGTWRGWSRMLAAALGKGHEVHYENFAVSGATAATVRHDQLQRAVERRPHLASLIVGVNDTMRSTWDPYRVRDDVLASVAELSRTGALVLTVRFHDHGAVFGLPGVVRRPLWRRIQDVNAAFDEAHQKFDTLQVDLAAEPAIYQRRYWSIDRLHPSELGHRHLAAEFARQLDGLGYDLAAPEPATPGMNRPHIWGDARWLATEGVPWLARRAQDLAPWAIGMLADEAKNRFSARLNTKQSGTPSPRLAEEQVSASPTASPDVLVEPASA